MAEDDLLHFLSRVDNQIKVAGWRIEPEAIKTAALMINGITQAGVAPLRKPDGTIDALVLYLSSDSLGPADEAEIRTRLTQAAGERRVPRIIRWSNDLPETRTGKIDWRALLALAERDNAPGGLDAQRMVALWSDPGLHAMAGVLMHPAIDPDDTFDAMAGDSLKALEVAVAIDEKLGIAIDSADLLDDVPFGDVLMDYVDTA